MDFQVPSFINTGWSLVIKGFLPLNEIKILLPNVGLTYSSTVLTTPSLPSNWSPISTFSINLVEPSASVIGIPCTKHPPVKRGTASYTRGFAGGGGISLWSAGLAKIPQSFVCGSNVGTNVPTTGSHVPFSFSYMPSTCFQTPATLTKIVLTSCHPVLVRTLGPKLLNINTAPPCLPCNSPGLAPVPTPGNKL